jgi:RecA-family ATPase
VRNMNGEERPRSAYEEWRERVRQGAETECGAAGHGTTLPVIDPREWQGKPVPEREWLVEGMIPHRTVTLFSGDGGSGKTQTALQLIVASSLGLQWLGKEVGPGPCLLYTAEDEADELHRRLAATVTKTGHRLADLEGVRLIPMAGRDAVLAKPNGLKAIGATMLFEKLKAEVERLNPRLIVIDPAADVFGGDEIVRVQVRQFVQKLASLAFDSDCAVVLLSHPSLTGLNSGSGTSGSTAWSNSVRSRLYLEAVKGDPDRRLLRVMKANYARTGDEIAIRWDDGVYVLDDGDDPAVESLIHAATDKLFLELLAMFTAQEQNVGLATGTNYAPAKMVKHPKAKGYRKEQFATSMQRLLDAGKIKVVTEGSPSRQRSRLVTVQ